MIIQDNHSDNIVKIKKKKNRAVNYLPLEELMLYLDDMNLCVMHSDLCQNNNLLWMFQGNLLRTC